MASTSALQVKSLRQKTGCGMMECKMLLKKLVEISIRLTHCCVKKVSRKLKKNKADKQLKAQPLYSCTQLHASRP